MALSRDDVLPGVRHRYVDARGLRMHIAEAGTGPLVLLLHGFPECWYSWRHQLTALAQAGYHAVAPDQRGYCRTGGPDAADEYTILHLTGDVIALMDALGEPRAVVTGHDWGAPVAWHTALLRPDRVRGVIGLSVPYRPRGSSPPIAAMRSMLGDGFYMIYFQQPGVADAELAADPRQTFTRLLYSASGDGPGGAPIVPPGGGFLDAVAGLLGPARLADQRGHRDFRDGIPGLRLHRAPQLVPQHRPQLGAHRGLAPRAGHRSRSVHRGGPRSRHQRARHARDSAAAARGRAAASRASPAQRLRPLDPAGAA
jgi:pimeloyl-ACP methyl ester carboxylesterase